VLASLRRWLLGQLALSPDLKHLDDGARRWHFGDDLGSVD
jgi:hypothetical protein